MIDETTSPTPPPEASERAAAAAPRRRRTGGPGQRRLTRRGSIPLFVPGEADAFRTRWLEIQANFVDEPGASVEQADVLVAEVMEQLARTFAEKRARLEPQLVKGEEISTEDLRMALRAYRSFFDRLLIV